MRVRFLVLLLLPLAACAGKEPEVTLRSDPPIVIPAEKQSVVAKAGRGWLVR